MLSSPHHPAEFSNASTVAFLVHTGWDNECAADDLQICFDKQLNLPHMQQKSGKGWQSYCDTAGPMRNTLNPR